jgi:hypothetical protein
MNGPQRRSRPFFGLKFMGVREDHERHERGVKSKAEIQNLFPNENNTALTLPSNDTE